MSDIEALISEQGNSAVSTEDTKSSEGPYTPANSGQGGGQYGGIFQAGADTFTTAVNWLMGKQMADKEIYLSNTAHQREVADLKAAGLNPALGIASGHGASTPNLPVPQLGRVNIADAMKLKYELKQMDSNIYKTVNETNKMANEADLADQLANKAKADTRVSNATATNLNIQKSLLELDKVKAEAQKGLYEGDAGKILGIIDYIMSKLRR